MEKSPSRGKILIELTSLMTEELLQLGISFWLLSLSILQQSLKLLLADECDELSRDGPSLHVSLH